MVADIMKRKGVSEAAAKKMIVGFWHDEQMADYRNIN